MLVKSGKTRQTIFFGEIGKTRRIIFFWLVTTIQRRSARALINAMAVGQKRAKSSLDKYYFVLAMKTVMLPYFREDGTKTG